MTTEHYGDPYAEQRALSGGTGAVDLSDREVLSISGPDRLSWLHSLLSQHVADLRPGASTEALVLNPQGHVEHHLHLVETGTEVLAHVEAGTRTALADFLASMRFMLRVEIEPRDLSVTWVPGQSDGQSEGLGTSTGFGTYLLGADVTPTAGTQAYDALRVAAGRPRFGLDTDSKTLAQEVGWLGVAVHLDKGCYRGQESVARVYNLGRPPRRLVKLHLDGSDSELPAVGAEVRLGDRVVGRSGTAVRHFEEGPLALALLKRNVPEDAQLVVDGITAAIEVLPDVVPESPARASAEARSGLLRF